ncbi:MAG: RluA family pseudouridine synthase [Desulfurivibrionaceae bacterium]|nr:RluA family pseudouridine synthase [Desulfurivibrionaceae bacterium]
MTQPAASLVNRYDIDVQAFEQGHRLDKVLHNNSRLAELSRSRIQKLIREGDVLVNGQCVKLSYKVQHRDHILVAIPAPTELFLTPQELPLDILFEDEHLIVINKDPGVVVHPAAGNMEGTLVQGLLYHCHDLAGIGGVMRPGIVHRLDKDTSGVLVVAKTDLAHQNLVAQFEKRQVRKIYLAIVAGCPAPPVGTIDTFIGRHPVHRKKMAVLARGGRTALTEYKVLEAFARASLVQVVIKTGRTHQIRVHMSHVGSPVMGDTVYGGKRAQMQGADRQCLHASQLTIAHPLSAEPLQFDAPLPEDMRALLAALGGDNG